MAQTKVVHKPRVLAADTLTGDKVVNLQNEDLGKIEHLMIDVEKGRVAYAVLAFGGFWVWVINCLLPPGVLSQ